MVEAKRRLRQDRWAEADARLAARKCGTAVDEDAGRELAWFQR